MHANFKEMGWVHSKPVSFRCSPVQEFYVFSFPSPFTSSSRGVVSDLYRHPRYNKKGPSPLGMGLFVYLSQPFVLAIFKYKASDCEDILLFVNGKIYLGEAFIHFEIGTMPVYRSIRNVEKR
jgi:hypothetical protein